jgi:ribosomal protein L37AE/L43A
MDPRESTDPSRHGCMICKAPQPYTVEQFSNGNTGWRCRACGNIVRLISGCYSELYGLTLLITMPGNP